MVDSLIRISVSNPSSMDSRDEGRVVIDLEDAVSGECLGRVSMSAGRFHQLTLGTTLTFHGKRSDNLDRVGKKMRVEQIKPERDLIPYTVRDAEEVERIVMDAGLVPDYWEQWSAYRHNYGWGLTGRWWEELSEQETADFNADQITYNDLKDY